MKTTTGIDKIRDMVSYFNSCNEGWLQQFSITQLVAIHDYALENEEEDYPDTWANWKLQEALSVTVVKR